MSVSLGLVLSYRLDPTSSFIVLSSLRLVRFLVRTFNSCPEFSSIVILS